VPCKFSFGSKDPRGRRRNALKLDLYLDLRNYIVIDPRNTDVPERARARIQLS